MINTNKLAQILESYRNDFNLPDPMHNNKTWWDGEKDKWINVKHFQDYWDINAPNFSSMFKKATEKTGSLLTAMNYFPRGMILEFANADAEAVRSMFKDLFDEDKPIVDRISNFIESSDALRMKYGAEKWKSHYQNINSISTYLWLMYPDKYYIYKYSECKRVAVALESDYLVKKGIKADGFPAFLNFYNEIADYISSDEKTTALLKKSLTSDCYEDPQFRTLTIDVGFYISRKFTGTEGKNLPAPPDEPVEPESSATTNDSDVSYWWLNANPKIWSFADIAVNSEQSYTLYNDNGNKRRIFQNFLDAKAGDIVIGYESTPIKQVVAVCEISREHTDTELCFKKIEGLTVPIDYQTLKECQELDNMEYFTQPQGSLFKLTKEEYNCIMDLIRENNPKPTFTKEKDSYKKKDFLNEVFMSENEYDSLVALLKNKKNVILQGAPGVGKTFAAKRLAYSIMEEKDDSRIEFVQFHQNYSYEDFMMGYKPTESGFELKYGIFYQFCQTAANHPDKEYFFIIDEINRGNMSKIFGELLMLIEKDYRGKKTTMAYSGLSFSVPENLYIIGMMNTADRSLAMIDYALRRRFSFFSMEPGFSSKGFKAHQASVNNEHFNKLIDVVVDLNKAITEDKSLGSGFCIGHSYFMDKPDDNIDSWVNGIVKFDIIPMLQEYWFDDADKVRKWSDLLNGAVNG